MLFGKTSQELKVGIFVFIGLVILVVFVLSIGGFKTWSSGYYADFSFNFVNGVKLGAPVRFAGVDVGVVKDIKIVYLPKENRNKIVVISWVKGDVKIPMDSTIWVNTLGLLGEKYIEIMPGTDYGKILSEHQEIAGKDPIAMHEVTELTKNIANDIDAVVLRLKNGQGTIGKLFTEETVYNDLEALVADIKKHPWKLFFKGKETPEKKKK